MKPLTTAQLKKIYDQYCCKCDETAMYDRFMVIDRAEGMRMWARGEREPYLDLVMGYSATNFGHQHPDIRRIVEGVIRESDHFHSFNCEDKILLSQFLVNKIPHRRGKFEVYFPVGGAMAVEVAIKLVRKRDPKRPHIMSFIGSFQGYSLGAMWLTDPSFVKAGNYLPLPGERTFIPYGGRSMAEMFEKLVAARKDVGGLMLEPVQGANGFVIPSRQDMQTLQKLCRKHDILLIADEIQSGVGRCGKFYAFEHFGLEPDIILLSKSLAGGYWPLSCCIARAELFENIAASGSGVGSTFGNSPIGTRIAYRVQKLVERKKWIENAESVGRYFTARLKTFEKRYPFVVDVTGIGLAQSFEIVTEKKSRTPDPKTAKLLQNTALKQRVIIYIAGAKKNRVKFALPLWVTRQDVDMVVSALTRVFDAVKSKK